MSDCSSYYVCFDSRDNASITNKTMEETQSLRDANPGNDDYKYWIGKTVMVLD